MRKYIGLTRLQLIDLMSRYTGQLNIKSKALEKLAILLPLLILAPMIAMVKSVYSLFSQSGYPELSVTYIYVALVPLLFFMAVPLVVSIFYYAKDAQLLASLPIRIEVIILSKLTTIYVNLISIVICLFAPVIYFYTVEVGFTLGSLLAGFIAVIFAPLIPIAFAVVAILPFMGAAAKKRRRNLWVIMANVLLIVVIILLQTLFTRFQMHNLDISGILSEEGGLLNFMGQKFPPSIWLTKMVMGSWLHGVYFLLLQVGVLLGTLSIAKALYRGTLAQYNQASGTSGTYTVKTHKKQAKRWLLIKRQMGIIYHNPTFLLNTILTLFVPILIIVITSATGEFNLDMLKDPTIAPYHLFIFCGFILSPTIVGSLSATAITREGKSFWETRVLPISARDNIMSRILCTDLICLTCSFILGGLGLWFMGLKVTDALLALGLLLVVTHLFSMADMCINIQRPFTNWTNPTAAVKNNLNVMLALVVRVVFIAPAWLLFKLGTSLTPSQLVLSWLVMAVVCAAMVYVKLLPIYEKKFIQID